MHLAERQGAPDPYGRSKTCVGHGDGVSLHGPAVSADRAVEVNAGQMLSGWGEDLDVASGSGCSSKALDGGEQRYLERLGK